jgi:hypothetical protein
MTGFYSVTWKDTTKIHNSYQIYTFYSILKQMIYSLDWKTLQNDYLHKKFYIVQITSITPKICKLTWVLSHHHQQKADFAYRMTN